MKKTEGIPSVTPRKDEAAIYFRRFARLGLDKRPLSPFSMYKIINGVAAHEGDAFKLLAVYDTVRLLSVTDPESVQAIKAVYFVDRGRNPKRNQISARVLRFASENHLDERTVYRRLKSAKELYYKLLG